MVAPIYVALGDKIHLAERVEARKVLTRFNVMPFALNQTSIVLPNHSLESCFIGLKLWLLRAVFFSNQLISPSCAKPDVFISLRHVHCTELYPCEVISKAHVHE